MEGLSDDWLAEDYSVFENCEARAGKVREGYWSPFPTLAWIVSRDERFTAATQLYEAENYANQGDLHTAAAWMVLGNIAGARYGRTFTDAAEELKEALEAGHIDGGTAIERSTGNRILVPRQKWPDWHRTFENCGLVLIPGHYDFKWPSEAICAPSAFPPNATAKPLINAIGSDGPDHTLPPWNGKCAPDKVKRITNRPGPSKRPREIRGALKPIFSRHHDRIAGMSERAMRDFVMPFWPPSAGSVPSSRTIKSHWDEHLEARARSARAESAS